MRNRDWDADRNRTGEPPGTGDTLPGVDTGKVSDMPREVLVEPLKLLTALQTVEKTMPFVVYRLMVLGGIGLALLLGALIGAGTLLVFGHFVGMESAFAKAGAWIGAGGVLLILKSLRGAVLHGVEGPHLWLVSQRLAGKPLPEGREQIGTAQRAVKEKMPSGLALLRLDSALGAVLRAVPWTGRAGRVDRLLGWLVGWSRRPLWAAALLVDALAPPAAAQRLLVAVLAQRGGWLRSVLLLRGWMDGMTLLVFPLMVYAVDALIASLPVDLVVWKYLGACVLSWLMRSVFFEPVAQTALLRMLMERRIADEPGTRAELEGMPAYRALDGL